MVRINMMCGKRNFGNSWVHIDGDDSHEHVWNDGIKLYSFPPRTVDLVYCSHGLAYFSTDEARALLRAWHEAMAPGATLRLATPDFDVLSKIFQEDKDWDKVKGPLYGEMDLNEKKIHHKTCYTEKTLTDLLLDAGFINVERYNHWETEHPNTGYRNDKFDDQSAAYIDGTLVSLNVQAIKPL